MPAMSDSEPDTDVAIGLLDAARELSATLATLRFAAPVAHVYDPHRHAWAPFEVYVRRFGARRKRRVFLGMNPGPFGMLQTGVPFGEIAAVRDWMGIEAPVVPPESMHPKRPIDGFDCRRSEVSGRRLWGWAAQRWGSAEHFFADAFVLNWCPLVWLEASGRNRTPVQLPADEMAPVQAACDRHLARALTLLAPDLVIGVGGFAERRLRTVLQSGAVDAERARSMRIGQILHPSPASPAANRGWADAVDAQLKALDVSLPTPHPSLPLHASSLLRPAP
jgi:single-strand selective monofunctional uracil DNA glycosylase